MPLESSVMKVKVLVIDENDMGPVRTMLICLIRDNYFSIHLQTGMHRCQNPADLLSSEACMRYSRERMTAKKAEYIDE